MIVYMPLYFAGRLSIWTTDPTGRRSGSAAAMPVLTWNAGRGRRSLAIGSGGEAEACARRRHRRRLAHFGLARGVPRVECRDLVEEGEPENRAGGHQKLPPQVVPQEHLIPSGWGTEQYTAPGGALATLQLVT